MSLSHPNYTLRQAAYFVSAAEHGSIADAARALNISQPSVSSAIGKLEDSLGVQLFIRHHAQGVSLTPAGQSLVVEMRALLAHAREVHDSAERIGDEVAGTFDVGCFSTLAPFYMPGLIRSFEAAYPAASLRLHEGMQTDLVGGLEAGRFEIAMLYDIELPSNIDMHLLAEFKPYVLLAEDHPLAGREALSLKELAGEPMVLLDMPPSSTYFTRIFIRAGYEPMVRYRSPSIETVRGMVANGYGFSILVIRPAGDLSYDGKRIVRRPILEDVPGSRVALARMAGTRPTRFAQAYTEACHDYFRNLPETMTRT